ncbi:alpha/beta hydrolase [Mesorhizobium sp. M0340]|uniref:alpha/beta fold hydrolase n=1 Tax=Mesorhizobium sp. M0340 TaxID=2956939 RepID=UPI00333568C1
MIAEHRISVGGVSTSYCESGAGEPILFLHGSPPFVSGKSSFVRQLNGLSDQFRVIAVDQIGCGGTDYPADYPPDRKYINRLGRVEHVIGFIEALGLKQITLAGNSEGSFVAARVAIVRPDLVSKLVLLTGNSVSPPFGDDRDEAWMRANEQAYDYSRPMPTEEEFITAWRGYGQDVEDAKREAYRLTAARGQYEVAQRLPEEETNFRLYVVLQQKYIIPYLHRLQTKTLIIWSKNDPLVTPDHGLKLAKLIRNSDFHLLNNAGHAIHIDQSEAVNRLIRKWAC